MNNVTILLLILLIFNNRLTKLWVSSIHLQNEKNNEPKWCLFRDLPPQPAELWIQLTCGYCYIYANTVWFNQKLPLRKADINGTRYIYSNVDGKFLDFDYRNEENATIVQASFKNDIYYNKFLECCYEAENCCDNVMTNENIIPTEEFPCPYVWDSWTCFPATKNDTINHKSCPSYVSSSTTQECLLYSNKECFANGTWKQDTDYSGCSTASIYRRRHNFHLYVLYVATAFMLPAIIIFCSIKKLHILRLMLHLNLISCIAIKNVLTMLSKNLVILDALKSSSVSNNVLVNSETPCKVLAVFDNIFKNLIFTSMFADGFNLHKMIVRPLVSDPNVFILIGLVIVCSIVPSLIWMTLMIVNEKDNCWMVDSDSWFQWITDGYKYVILAINSTLLMDIFRVLIFKLKHRRSSGNTKAALRAAILLVPLFGVPLIITSQREIFDKDDCTAGDIYYYITYTFEGLQGVLAALFFCYLNVEVKHELKNIFRKLFIQIRNKIDVNHLTKTRRSTTMTNVRQSVTARSHNDGNTPNMLSNKEAFN